MKFRKHHPSYFREGIGRKQAWGLGTISLFVLIFSVGCIVTAGLLKKQESEIGDDIFVIWAAFPALLIGILGVIASFVKKKIVVAVFLFFAVLTIILCALACVMSGLAYVNGSWSFIGDKAKDCVVKTGEKCSCTSSVEIDKPFQDSDCGILLEVYKLLLAQSGLLAITTLFLVISTFAATTFLCCAEWAYLKDEHLPTLQSTYPVRCS